jgi:hypothetical protein
MIRVLNNHRSISAWMLREIVLKILKVFLKRLVAHQMFQRVRFSRLSAVLLRKRVTLMSKVTLRSRMTVRSRMTLRSRITLSSRITILPSLSVCIVKIASLGKSAKFSNQRKRSQSLLLKYQMVVPQGTTKFNNLLPNNLRVKFSTSS